jgi:hypothetical protein
MLPWGQGVTIHGGGGEGRGVSMIFLNGKANTSGFWGTTFYKMRVLTSYIYKNSARLPGKKIIYEF